MDHGCRWSSGLFRSESSDRDPRSEKTLSRDSCGAIDVAPTTFIVWLATVESVGRLVDADDRNAVLPAAAAGLLGMACRGLVPLWAVSLFASLVQHLLRGVWGWPCRPTRLQLLAYEVPVWPITGVSDWGGMRGTVRSPIN